MTTDPEGPPPQGGGTKLSAEESLLAPGRPKPEIQRLAKEVLRRLAKSRLEDWAAPEEEVRALARALRAPHPYVADQMIQRLVGAGVDYQRIYRCYLAEAARELGTHWEEDRVTFMEVSIATSRIYSIIDRLRTAVPPPSPSEPGKLAFCAVPGEAHTIGLDMAVDVFRRNGWEVLHLVDKTHDEIIEALGDVRIFLIGLSASGPRVKEALLRLVVALRVARPDLRILVSGKLAATEADFIHSIGADSVVQTAEEALIAVREMITGGGAARR